MFFSKIRRLFHDLPVSLLIVGNVFLFIPFSIYRGNADEFAVSLSAMLVLYVLPALVIVFFLNCIGTLLNEDKYKRYIAVLFALAVLIWLQGNVIVWDYGVVGKGNIDWSQHAWRGWLDGAIWLSLLVVGWVFYKRAYRIAGFACLILLVLQLFFLGIVSLQKTEIWKEKAAVHQPPQELYAFSSEQNVIHIILDELQAGIFKEIIDTDADHYYKALKGFTFFQETSGSFPTTVMSMPALLSGEVYKNDVPIRTFVNSVYKGATIPNILFDKGYAVDLAASLGWYRRGKHSTWYYVPVPYRATISQFKKSTVKQMSRLVLYRCLPLFLSKAFRTGVLAFPVLAIVMKDVTTYEAQRHFAHEEFLQDMIDNMYVKGDKPVYKFIHLNTTHYPAVLNKDGKYAGKVLPWTWDNIRVQDKYSFDHVMEFIQKLKDLKIYDSSLIILQADHGYWKIRDSLKQFQFHDVNRADLGGDFANYEQFAKVACASNPLLAVKPPHSEGTLRISDAETMLTDLPATINSVLHLGENVRGRSVFEVKKNEIRERVFYYYNKLNRAGDDYFNHLDEYVIRGRLFDRASWHFVRTVYPQGSSYQASRIDFGTDQASPFLRSGWSTGSESAADGMSYNWALNNFASVVLSLPGKQVKLTANVKSPFPPGQQIITVKVDGREVGRWVLSKAWVWEEHSVTLQADANRPQVSVVEFNFSKNLDPNRVGQDKRPLAVLFESLTVKEDFGKN
ncbi:MAG: sulfatase-like hydrolase/transferase [Acidobacteriota bacterium]